MSTSLLKSLKNCIGSYRAAHHLSISDFVNKLFSEEQQNEQKTTIKAFIQYVKHEDYLEDISKMFLIESKLYHANVENVKLQIYFIMFLLSSENLEEIITQSQYYTKDLLEFLLNENNHKNIAREGCKRLEIDHVLEDIIEPFLAKRPLVESALRKINSKHFLKPSSKKPTIPTPFEFSKRVRQTPKPPVNTMTNLLTKATDIPITNTFPDTEIINKIADAHKKNQQKSMELFMEASKMPQHLTEPKKVMRKESEPKITLPKVKPAPPRKQIQIRDNLTTTLREASRMLKQQEKEIKTIEEILKGGCDLQRIEELENEYRKSQQLEEMETIQKKRLHGMLSYEEAIIARKKLLDATKRKVQDFKKARADMLEQLEAWKEREQEKMKENVERSQNSKKDLKVMERKHIEEKQNQVRLQQYKTKEMLRKAYEEKEKELSKKIELIQELKTIHEISIRINSKREFDPTETANLGLFCEMSIAELQERLILAKMQMERELDAKRQRIIERKAEQQQMIENVKNFIAQNRRMSKTKIVPINEPNLERSPQLIELEKLLQEKRCLRLKITQVGDYEF